MLLRDLLRKRNDLKLILMSATLKANDFSSYFGSAPVLDIPGRTFPVEQLFLEDIYDTTSYILEEGSKYTRKVKGGWEQLGIELQTADVEATMNSRPRDNVLDENLSLSQLMARYEDYSSKTYKNLYVMDYDAINYELIEKTLEWIVEGDHDYPRSGTILVSL